MRRLKEGKVNGIVPALFFLSGFCSLVYQMVWARWLGLVLGNFGIATAIVVATFMCGLAAGNAVFGRYAARRGARDGLLLYAVLEGGLALMAACSPLVFSRSSSVYAFLAGSFPTPLARAAICAAFLLPPTVLMGGTLPAVVKALTAAAPAVLGPLYALNTVGGALGPLVSAFVLMPVLGMRVTVWIAAAVNMGLAFLAFRAARGERSSPCASEAGDRLALPAAALAGDGLRETGPAPAVSAGHPVFLPYAFAAFGGFLALAFEITLTRLMVLVVTDSSVYGFAIVLSAFLAGIALGACLLRRWPVVTAADAFLAFSVAMAAAWLFSLTTPFWDMLPAALLRLWWLHLPLPAHLAVTYIVAFVLLAALASASGYALPALAAALGSKDGSGIGWLFAANTLGGAAGALLAGSVLMPRLGVNAVLLWLGAAAAFACAIGAIFARPLPGRYFLFPVPLLAAGALLLPRFDPNVMHAGVQLCPDEYKPGPLMAGTSLAERTHLKGTIEYAADGASGSVAVYRRDEDDLTFTINGKPDGSTGKGDMINQVLSAHLPLLMHGAPSRVLLIGLGSGITGGSLLLHDGVGTVDIVEIEPRMFEVAECFSRQNNRVLSSPRVRIHWDDARHFLGSGREKYDVIISEPSNLFVSGMVNLFTREFYRTVRGKLADRGVFFQWIHCYQMDVATILGLLNTVRTEFPYATYWVNSDGDSYVIAGPAPLTVDADLWVARLGKPGLKADLGLIGIGDPWEIFSSFLWGTADVERHAAGGRICEDDNPYPEFSTPFMKKSHVQTMRNVWKLGSCYPLDPMPLVRETTGIRIRLGDVFLGAGRFNRAGAEYVRALGRDPGSATAAYGAAYCDFAVGRKKAARAALLNLLARNPGHRKARVLLDQIGKAPVDTPVGGAAAGAEEGEADE
jgi:spermidine synthase